MLPVAYVIYFLGLNGIILIIVFFLSGIALTLVKIYKFAAVLLLIGGILTVPLGILGIISFVLILLLSNIQECPVCRSELMNDIYCPVCRTWYLK
jgi:hypothetical protein